MKEVHGSSIIKKLELSHCSTVIPVIEKHVIAIVNIILKHNLQKQQSILRRIGYQ